MNRYDELLDRLATRARREMPPGGNPEMPVGFAARVLAHAKESAERESSLPWERLTFRAVPMAALMFVLCALLTPHSAPPPADYSAETLANEIFNEFLLP
jgi:hypothetical protein